MKEKKGKKKKKGKMDHDKSSDQKEGLPMVQPPTEFPSIHNEMAELFDEDRVTHKHGSSEPESD